MQKQGKMKNLFTTSPGQEGVPAISNKDTPLKWLVQGSCISTVFLCVFVTEHKQILKSEPALAAIHLSFLFVSVSLSLKFLHLPLLAGVDGCSQEDYDSYLLGLSSDRNLNDYLVELFVERLPAVYKLNQEQLCIA